jgi:hypothetical protein
MKKKLVLIIGLLFIAISTWAQSTITFPGNSLSGSFGAWGGTGHFYSPTFNVNAPGGIDIIYYDIDVSQFTNTNVWSLEGVALPGVSASNFMTSIDPEKNSVWCNILNQNIASSVDWNGQALSTVGFDGIVRTSDDSRHQGTQDWYRDNTGGLKIDGPAAGPYYNNESYVTPNLRHPSAPAKTASELNTYDFRLRILPTGTNSYTYEMWFRMHNSAATFEGASWFPPYNPALNNSTPAAAWRAFTANSDGTGTTVFPISNIDLSSVHVFMGLGNFQDPAAQSLTWGNIEVTGTLTAFPNTVWVDPSYTSGNSGTHIWNYDAFATIQAGINGVAVGGTVNVAAGTYAGNITINKSITLLGDPGDALPGPGANAPVIDGGSLPGSAFFIANGVSNVTIKGFEMRNFTSPELDGIGNGISAWVGSTSNITILDNYFHNLGYNGVLVGNDYSANPLNWGDHSNWLIKSNIIENFGFIGFELTNTSNSSIEGNVIHMMTPFIGAIFSSARRSETGLTIKNNQIDGTPSIGYPVIYMYAYDLDMPSPNLNSVLIEGNVIASTGTPFQIYIRNIGTGTVTGVQAHFNSLSTFKNLTSAQINATCNWWGNVNGPGSAAISGNVVFTPWLTSGIDNEPLTPGFQPVPLSVNAGTDVTFFLGYDSSVKLTATVSGGSGNYSYSWSPGGATTQSIKVSPATTTTYTVTVTDGCFSSSDEVIVNVQDVRCQKNKVIVCHNGNELCISPNAVPAHLAHGDKLGHCGDNPEQIISEGIPAEFQLYTNYPNPFNPVTRISFDIPKQGFVSLKIFDVLGREVKTLVNEVKGPGNYMVDFNGSELSSGVYFYRLQSAEFTDTKRMLMIK